MRTTIFLLWGMAKLLRFSVVYYEILTKSCEEFLYGAWLTLAGIQSFLFTGIRQHRYRIHGIHGRVSCHCLLISLPLPQPLLPHYINSLWPSDAIWRHRFGSTLVQVMACCLTAPSHYLNQCWLISKVQRHSAERNFTWNNPAISR